MLRYHRGLCPTLLVILSANSSSPPALYSVLIISPLSCPRVCCLVSVRMRCSEAQFISLLIILADPIMFFFFFLSCRSGAPVFAILPFRYTPAALGLWPALCLGVFLFVCPSFHGIPPYSSLLDSGAPSGFQRWLPIAFSLPLYPAGSAEAGLFVTLWKWAIFWRYMPDG